MQGALVSRYGCGRLGLSRIGVLGDCGTHLKVVSPGQEVTELAVFPASPVRVWLSWRSFRSFHLAISIIMAFTCHVREQFEGSSNC